MKIEIENLYDEDREGNEEFYIYLKPNSLKEYAKIENKELISKLSERASYIIKKYGEWYEGTPEQYQVANEIIAAYITIIKDFKRSLNLDIKL